MSKFFTLLRASMSEGMSLFKINTKNSDKTRRTALFAVLVFLVSMAVYGYADMMLEPLAGTGMEYFVLTIYSLVAVVFILMEGIYKAPGLLFNCRDDGLVLSLPVKKMSVFLMRIMKFYLFEVAFSALILVPTMMAYVTRMGGAVPATFYVVGMVALILLPVVPVIVSVILAMITTEVTSRFRFKNLVQIILTTILLVGVLTLSLNIQNIMTAIAENASSINEVITKLYYPVGAFIQMVTDFNILTLLLFIVINVGLAAVFVWAFSKVYFRINSRVKVVKVANKKHKESKLKARGVMAALIIKELRRFVSSPVFIINAGFSLVLYMVATVAFVVNFDGVASALPQMGVEMPIDEILGLMPAIVAVLVVFCSLMTSITSSMISLEGKTINLLKSMPVLAFKIIMAKVLMAVLVMVPIFWIGDIVMFVKFDFDVWQILMILALSVVMPVVAEVLGIIVNLKYPKMDAESDAEVVKQSMSSMVAVFTGMLLAAMTVYVIYMCVSTGASATMAVAITLTAYTIAMVGLIVRLKICGEKDFKRIDA